MSLFEGHCHPLYIGRAVVVNLTGFVTNEDTPGAGARGLGHLGWSRITGDIMKERFRVTGGSPVKTIRWHVLEWDVRSASLECDKVKQSIRKRDRE